MTSAERVNPSRLLLLLPVAIILGLFFTSVVMLFSNAFMDRGELSLRYFRQILERPDYLLAFYRTIVSSVVVAVLAVVLAYPIAMLLWRASDRWRNLLLILVLVPWLVSLVVRSYGWIILLGPRGFINSMLAWVGVIDDPLPLMFNDFGIIVGLTHVLMPFAVIAFLWFVAVIRDRLGEQEDQFFQQCFSAAACYFWPWSASRCRLPAAFWWSQTALPTRV